MSLCGCRELPVKCMGCGLDIVPRWTRCRHAALVFITMWMAIGCAQAQSAFALKNGDRIIFYGDSITEPRLYTSFVETYVLTRFPRDRFEFRDSAWGGDRVDGGRGGSVDVRLQRDVIAHRPTVFVLMLGINDGRGQPFNTPLYDRFAAGYEHIVGVLRRAIPELRITALQPSPYDEVTRAPVFGGGGYNGVMVRYGDFVKNFGEREGLTVADLNAPLVSVLVAAEAKDPALAKRIAGDGTHPGVAGHLILAEAVLKAWHAPALVSDVAIDAAAPRVRRAENANITDLRIGRGISWTELDDVLPFAVDLSDPAIALAVNCSDFAQALDRQTMEVNGLRSERYLLTIDADRIGTFDAAQLQRGINLALLNTPMTRQALEVHELTIQRNEVQFGRWRQVEMALANDSPPHKQAALAALNALQEDLLAKQRALAVPVAHHFELTPQ
jgi:lysophospholipase L1-like esterase